MAKQSEIDKLLEQLEQSEVLKRLILAVKRFWYSDESPSTSVYNANAQSVDQTLFQPCFYQQVPFASFLPSSFPGTSRSV